jgi:hypothetical protein
MKDQPLCSDCHICGAGPSVGEPSPPDGHIRHTLISPYVLYKVAPAPPVYPLRSCHHVQHVPTKNTVYMLMLGMSMTNMDHIIEGLF